MAAFLLAGCSSYSEIAYWKSPVKIDDGEIPLASFVTNNVSYQFLGIIPICTGRPWTSGDVDRMDKFNVRPFADEATLDNNLVSLRYALDRVGSHRITKLYATEDTSWAWSFFLVRRRNVQTKCIILREK